MSKITKSAKGQDCQIRLYGVCNFNPETVVLCHLGGGGMGAKSHDIHGAYGCSSCHDAIDGRVSTIYSRESLQLAHHEGVIRTQLLILEQGLIKI